jgi:hypothetical protein
MKKDITVRSFLSLNGQLTFRRCLPQILFDQWLEVVNSFPFEDVKDSVVWKWEKMGDLQPNLFMITSQRVILEINNYRHIGKAKIPYMIKIFTWLLEQNVILTKDNMVRRKWVGGPKCYFCFQNESVEHLLQYTPI